MRTYAEYLTTMTVKTLNTIAKDMNLKGYSKLRKAELIEFIDNNIKTDAFEAAEIDRKRVVILDVENPADHDTIAALIAEFAVEPSESVADALVEATPADIAPTLEDLKAAYRNMRATVNGMGARGAEGIRRVKYVGRLRNLSAQLKSAGVKYPQYL